jgi:diguanylate cyclase (GGDEF)-like protein
VQRLPPRRRTLDPHLDRDRAPVEIPSRPPATAATDAPAPPVPRGGQRLVLVMNHGRAPLDDLVARLTAAGHAVQVGETLAQSHRLAAATRPDAVLLNPLVLCEGSVELEFVESLQAPDDPIPVVVLVPDLAALACIRRLALPLRDFALTPARADECVGRVELALEARASVRDLHGRATMLERQVSIDFKTGLTSERHMRTLIEREWKRAQRHQNPLSLLLIDIDDFKGVNDATDYAFGDEVLRRVADGLKGTVRETDFAARFGGDEFCVLLPQTTPAEAVQTALRIRQRIAGTTVSRGAFRRDITVSIGVDSYDGRSAASVEALRRNANLALQEAKRRGKNQVWLHATAERQA